MIADLVVDANQREKPHVKRQHTMLTAVPILIVLCCGFYLAARSGSVDEPKFEYLVRQPLLPSCLNESQIRNGSSHLTNDNVFLSTLFLEL